jgi:TolA-binding protein
MNRAELHPEHLIDLERDDALTASQAEQLGAHRLQCDSCRLEALLHGALATTEDDAAACSSETSVEAALAEFLARRPAAPAALHSLAPAPPGKPATRWRRATVPLVAFLSGAGVAAAAAGIWIATRVAPAQVSTAAAAHMAQASAASSSGPAPTASAPAAATTASSSAAVASHSAEKVHSSSIVPGATAISLFAEATAARRANELARAASLYRKLQHDFPQSQETVISRLALGRLELQRGQPQAALAELDAYVASNGKLRQEAQLGRAQALEQLGRWAQARATYQLIVEQYPDSIYADRARLRLERGK